MIKFHVRMRKRLDSPLTTKVISGCIHILHFTKLSASQIDILFTKFHTSAESEPTPSWLPDEHYVLYMFGIGKKGFSFYDIVPSISATRTTHRVPLVIVMPRCLFTNKYVCTFIMLCLGNPLQLWSLGTDNEEKIIPCHPFLILFYDSW